MLARALRNGLERSHIIRNAYSPSHQLLSSKFATDETKGPRTKLSLRRQKLPEFPPIDFVDDLKVERFLPENFKVIQHGDAQYQTCLENYVQVYSSGYQMKSVLEPNGCGGYAVYYAENHPLNETGPVERRQALHHTKLYAFLRALKSVPQSSFSKITLNVDDKGLGRFITQNLPVMSENAFRSAYTGRLNKDLETSMEINTLLRTRQDLTFRVQYTPHDISFPPAKLTCDMAKRAASDAQRQQRKLDLSDEF